MLLTYAVVALVFLVPIFVAWLTWRLTRRIQRFWLRALVRAIILAAAFTPTIAPVTGLHGALPMPAIWIFICGIFGWGNEDRMIDLRYGGVPLLVVFIVIWVLSVVVSYIRYDRST